MQVKSRFHNNILYVALCGKLNESTSVYTKLKMDEVFANANAKQVIIDFSQLDFLDSMGIGVIMERYKKMKDKDIPIYICNS